MGYRSKVIMGVKNEYVKGLEDILIDCNFDVKKDRNYLIMIIHLLFKHLMNLKFCLYF